ncbi:MAG: nuclear transport factor 2 family protein, partial [Pseudoxanthomonas sp.]
ADTPQTDGPSPTPLFNEIAALDTKVFDAFNHCAEPGRLDEHAGYFSPDVEFYHDTGGVTWTRDEMIANTRKYVCGHFTRELIAGTTKVYPVKDFGAISQGEHRFCQVTGGKCEGLADFIMVWRKQDGQWQITRVLSYGHRTAADASR